MSKSALNRVGSGVYLIREKNGDEHFISGKLSFALAEANSGRYVLPELLYLSKRDEQTCWVHVCIDTHDHYYGAQQKLLYRWLFATECPLSLMGRKRFANITGITASRINHALRRPDTPDYQPFSEQAMMFIEWKVDSFLQSNNK